MGYEYGSVTVDTEAMEATIQALSVYIDDISGTISRMKDAAQDCSDNMGNDIISQKNIGRLELCIEQLSATLVKAEELKRKIAKELSETVDGF